MTTYTAITQESSADLASLSKNNYNLQVAKSVSTPGGSPTYNVVFGSTFLGPNMSVAWITQYGLNWSTSIPSQGSQVLFSGNWQACNIGDSYDLDKTGTWKANQSDPHADKNSLNVGSNGYQTDVHIIVGVQDPNTKQWSPIWVGTDALLVNANGQYQPRESVKLWYQEGELTATMISSQGTVSTEYDMSTNHTYYFYYDVKNGKWQSQSSPFTLPNAKADSFHDEDYDLIPLISIRRGVHFEGLSFHNLRIEV